MVNLEENSFIGEGAHRKCFVLPSDENLCVKVVKDGHLMETERELEYYKFLEKKGISWEMMPRYHENIETNFGTGAVFDLVRDFDGEISKDLGYYFNIEQNSREFFPGLLEAFKALEKYMYREKILTLKLKERNILYKREDEKSGKLVIIDDIGNTELIPISSYISYFATKKIERKLSRFKKELMKRYPQSSSIKEII